MRSTYARGVRLYGSTSLDYREFEACARRHLRARCDPGFLAHNAATLSPDLYLAAACATGAPGSWECLERHFGPRLNALARSRGASDSQADEIVRNLPGALVLPPGRGGHRTRIGSYDGSCSLFTWLATIVLRRIADRARERKKLGRISTETAAPLARWWAITTPRFEVEEIAKEFDRALAAAWDALSPREAALLRFKYRDQIPQSEMAALLGIGAPRVCRLLQRALRKLRADVLCRLPGSDSAEHSWNDDVRQQACLSLARLLANSPDART